MNDNFFKGKDSPESKLTCAESFLVCVAYLDHSASSHSCLLRYIAVAYHPQRTTVPLPTIPWHDVPELTEYPYVVGVVCVTVVHETVETFDACGVYWMALGCAFGTVASDDYYYS